MGFFSIDGLNIIFEKMAWLKQGLLVLQAVYTYAGWIPMLRFGIFKNQQEEVTTVELLESAVFIFYEGITHLFIEPQSCDLFLVVYSLYF